jgi:hypothetical protein
LITGTYTLTVSNPGGESGSLVDAFTVTQGIGVWTTDGPYGGYIVGIEKKPGTPTTIYALASNVGLFASEDAGGSWELIYKSEGSTDLVFDAQDPEVMYYGAADGCFVRTANGGDTWEIPSQIPATGDCYLAFPAAHPSSAGAVYVGIGSCEGIPFSPGDGGVFRSDDYGDTWITCTCRRMVGRVGHSAPTWMVQSLRCTLIPTSPWKPGPLHRQMSTMPHISIRAPISRTGHPLSSTPVQWGAGPTVGI